MAELNQWSAVCMAEWTMVQLVMECEDLKGPHTLWDYDTTPIA